MADVTDVSYFISYNFIVNDMGWYGYIHWECWLMSTNVYLSKSQGPAPDLWLRSLVANVVAWHADLHWICCAFVHRCSLFYFRPLLPGFSGTSPSLIHWFTVFFFKFCDSLIHSFRALQHLVYLVWMDVFKCFPATPKGTRQDPQKNPHSSVPGDRDASQLHQASGRVTYPLENDTL